MALFLSNASIVQVPLYVFSVIAFSFLKPTFGKQKYLLQSIWTKITTIVYYGVSYGVERGTEFEDVIMTLNK